MSKNEEDLPEKNPIAIYVKIGALICLALLLIYGKLVWPFIHGRMVKENIGFVEAASSEHILIGGFVALVILVVGGWVWASRN